LGHMSTLTPRESVSRLCDDSTTNDEADRVDLVDLVGLLGPLDLAVNTVVVTTRFAFVSRYLQMIPLVEFEPRAMEVLGMEFQMLLLTCGVFGWELASSFESYNHKICLRQYTEVIYSKPRKGRG